MNLISLDSKKKLYNRLHSSNLYSHYVIHTLRKSVEDPNHTDCATFSQQLKFERAVRRLQKPTEKIHPALFFRCKHNQRLFLGAIGAPTVPAHYAGPINRAPTLPDGLYVIKPLQGNGGNGVESLDLRDGMIIEPGFRRPFRQYLREYSQRLGISSILVEERLEDAHFQSIVDYKVYWFKAHGVDHVLCIIRSPRLCGVSFSPDGDQIETGKYTESKIDPTPPNDTVSRVVSIASRIAPLVPLSFVRLDLYASTSGIFVGEITPLPGSSRKFSPDYNMRLGRKWADSRQALREDVVNSEGWRFFKKHNIRAF